MIGRALLLSTVFGAAVAMPAQAARFGGVGMEAGVPSENAAPVQLAQAREVDIYYDQSGREVLVDRYTGEVIAIRERGFRQELPRAERRDQDRYYLDDPDDVARLRRLKRMEELGRAAPPVERFPEYRDYRVLPEPIYPEEEFAREEPWYGELPDARGVERQPLDRTPGAEFPPQQSELPRQTDPGAVIEDTAPATGLPQTGEAPEISHGGASEEVASIQILLDRAGVSPGVIDGRMGDNVNKAITAYREVTGETLRTYDKDYIAGALAERGGDAFTTYEITAVDAAGPFVASVPSDYGEKAKLERLGFTSVAEMLAERFHMDEKYLRAINPGLDFNRPGTVVKVANVGKPRTGKVARIVADKGRKQVRAYGADGSLVAIYPSTIGSASTPSPTGTHTVERVAVNPEYTYNPKINFKQGDNDKVLTIPPGPNGPVGTIWIALSKPTYGIHGTPDPSKIGKTESNGCIRLTNWDAEELAGMVEKGVTVEFVE